MSLKKVSLEQVTQLGFDEPTAVVKLPDPERQLRVKQRTSLKLAKPEKK